MKKLNIGCGPLRKEGWINVDIQPFRSVDLIMDVTKSWDFEDVDIVYAEHFIEHLTLEQGINFLYNAAKSLRHEGYIRVSTPNVEWVLKTHYKFDAHDGETALSSVTNINRAFHGWGHQFLYSSYLLERIFKEMGLDNISFNKYGESDHALLVDLEEHGNYSLLDDGCASVIIIQARKNTEVVFPTAFYNQLYEKFIRYDNSIG